MLLRKQLIVVFALLSTIVSAQIKIKPEIGLALTNNRMENGNEEFV